jgi:hypothetical protein
MAMFTTNDKYRISDRQAVSLRAAVSSAADSWAALTPPLFFLVTFLLESVQIGYSRVSSTISELALLPFGWMENTLFCLMGLALLVIAGRLCHIVTNGIVAKLDAALLALAGLGFFIIAICPTGPDGKALSVTSSVHLAAAALIAALSPLVCLILARSLRKTRKHRLIYNCLLTSGLTGLGLGAVAFFAVVFGLNWLGGIERAVTLSGLAGIECIIVYLTQAHGMTLPRVPSPRVLTHSLFFPPRLAHAQQNIRNTTGNRAQR